VQVVEGNRGVAEARKCSVAIPIYGTFFCSLSVVTVSCMNLMTVGMLLQFVLKVSPLCVLICQWHTVCERYVSLESCFGVSRYSHLGRTITGCVQLML
jgi:hypothetical protein